MARSEMQAKRTELLAICRQLHEAGLSPGTSGNASVRCNGGFLITPTGVALPRLSPSQLVPMDLGGDHRGRWLPSSEWRMHRDIYRRHPAAGAVVHTHSLNATAVSCLRKDVPAFHYMVAIAGGDSVPCAAYATFGTEALSSNVLDALAHRRACLLSNHGMICYGDHLQQALSLAVEIEALCAAYLLALQGGQPVILDAAEMARVLEGFGSYGRQPGTTGD